MNGEEFKIKKNKMNPQKSYLIRTRSFIVPLLLNATSIYPFNFSQKRRSGNGHDGPRRGIYQKMAIKNCYMKNTL